MAQLVKRAPPYNIFFMTWRTFYQLCHTPREFNNTQLPGFNAWESSIVLKYPHGVAEHVLF